jgi:hypothetical protein
MVPMSFDLLTKVCGEIDARLAELRPLVAEYEQLLGAADAIATTAAEASTPPAAASRTAAKAPARKAARKPAKASGATAATARARGPRGSAAGAIGRAVSVSTRQPVPDAGVAASKPERATRGAAQQAIVAALEHGSHTVSELVVVTAMSGANVRDNLRRLQKTGTVGRAKRDGRAAYALAVTAER